MRWFRRNSSDRNLDDDDSPQLIRLTSLTRKPTDNNHEVAAPVVSRAPLSAASPAANGFLRGRLPVANRNGEQISFIETRVEINRRERGFSIDHWIH